MKVNLLKEKSIEFAVRIVNLYKYLTEDKKEFIMSKQVLRSGTSIGANIAESVRAESEADFIHKLSISRKEGEETLYWLEILQRTDYLSPDQHASMKQDCEELLKLLTSITITMRKRIHNS